MEAEGSGLRRPKRAGPTLGDPILVDSGIVTSHEPLPMTRCGGTLATWRLRQARRSAFWVRKKVRVAEARTTPRMPSRNPYVVARYRVRSTRRDGRFLAIARRLQFRSRRVELPEFRCVRIIPRE